MKKVIGMLALVALVGNIANAELLKNFKATGSMEALGMNVNNSVDFNKKTNDKFGDVKPRLTINAGFDLNEDANAVVSVVKNNQNYGNATRPESANTVSTQMFFTQAYINLMNVFGINHKVGRQYYGNDNDIVIYFGPANWYTRGLGVTAIDGWTADWSKNKWAASAMLSKLADTGLAANTDTDLYGVTASYDFSEIVKPTAYYYDAKVMAGTLRNNLQVAGIKANGMYKGVSYGAEYAMNMGRNQALAVDYKGFAFKANAAYGIDLAGKLGFNAEYAMGSGDKKVDNKDKSFEDINANYRPGLIIGGVGVTGLAVTGLNDLTTWNAGANWTPSKVEKLNLAAAYYDFSKTEKVAGVKHYGSEADLIATWNHSQNVALKLGLATFMPAKKFTAPAKHDAVNLASLYMNVKF